MLRIHSIKSIISYGLFNTVKIIDDAVNSLVLDVWELTGRFKAHSKDSIDSSIFYV